MYLTHKKKYVVARCTCFPERKYMTSASKNVYIDKFDDIVNKCNNVITYTIKMKPTDVKSNRCINSSIEVNNIDRSFKTSDIVRDIKI